MGILKKKPPKIDYKNSNDIIKQLNSKRTTIGTVMEGLHEMVYGFQNEREEFYVKEIEEKLANEEIELDDFDLDLWAERIQQQIYRDSKLFVNDYVTVQEDAILDAINEDKIKKDPAHAFLILLRVMKEAFDDIE